MRIRVLISAGSAVALDQLARDLANDHSLDIAVATGVDHLLRQFESVRPGVLLLDSRVAGCQTPQLVRTLIERTPLPILLRTEPGEFSEPCMLDCIDAGALAILHKPVCAEQLMWQMPSLIWAIKSAASAAVANLQPNHLSTASTKHSGNGGSILAIGAGMGGANRLAGLLAALPADSPAAVVIAPLPEQLIAAWVDRISTRCRVAMKVAGDGDVMKPGQVLISPGDRHLLPVRRGGDWIVRIKDGPAVFRQKPSIELLLDSIAQAANARAVGVLLGGAGIDGIGALLRLRKAGGRTLTESPQYSLFPDLCTRALQCGAAQISASPDAMVDTILRLSNQHFIPQAA